MAFGQCKEDVFAQKELLVCRKRSLLCCRCRPYQKIKLLLFKIKRIRVKDQDLGMGMLRLEKLEDGGEELGTGLYADGKVQIRSVVGFVQLSSQILPLCQDLPGMIHKNGPVLVQNDPFPVQVK